MLEILAVLLAIFGFIILLGFFSLVPTSFDVPLGIGILIVGLFLFVYGWYSYIGAAKRNNKSGKMN